MKVATIGSGGICRRHLEVLAGESDVEIVGHVTRSPEHAEEVAAHWGGRPYTDYRALLEQERPDVVWICVPPGSHGPIEFDLIERGIPFFVEKPLDADAQTAERIAAALQGTGILAGVAYHWRAMDTLAEVRQTLAENPARMVLGAWHDATPPPRWWRHQAESGGQMVEQATHLFDLARYLLGNARVLAATALRHDRPAYPDADVADVSAALLQFGGDIAGVFTATCLLGGPAAIHLQLVCEGLLITIDQTGVVYDTGSERRQIPLGNDPFVAEDRAFLAALRAGDPEPILCTYQDALQTHRLCCAVREAAESMQQPH